MSEPVAKQRPMIDLDEFERRLRRPEAAPHPQDDPLAELARLVGGHEDPFKTVFDRDRQPARAPAVSAPNMPPRPAPAQPRYAGDDAQLHGTIHPRSYETDELSASDYDPVPGNLAQADENYAYLDTPPVREPLIEAPRSRRPLYVMAGIIAAGIAGISVSFAYKSKSGPHEIATIMAMSGPTKVQPDSPGGVDVPNQDASILDKSPQQTPTGLNSHQEEPVDLARQPMTPPAQRTIVADAGGTGAASVPVPPSSAQVGVESYGIGALIEPKRVKTVSVRSDGTLLPNDTPPQIAPSVTASPAPVQHQTPPSAATTPKPASAKSTARVVTTPKPAPQTMEQLAADSDVPPSPPASAPPKPKPAAKPIKVAEAEAASTTAEATGKPAGDGAFSVQFAAPGSEPEAHEITAKLGTKFGSELSGHRLTYHRVKVGEKTVFRIRTSGLSKEEATEICQKVQGSGGKCFVAKD